VQHHADGTSSLKSSILGLNQDSKFHTFRHEEGLLFSTQFAQAAIILTEIAIFKDYQSKGLLKLESVFAGHSLGEYGALFCMGDIMPAESLLDLVFQRGTMFQGSAVADSTGRTCYAMVAVNPSRISQCE
jgi:malonyl CoA-acyl carrier protein transacylase